MENGYHLYDFKGELLREEHIDKFKQLSWRPRPPTLLSKEEQKTIRKNLREYSKDFEEQDRIEEDKEKGAIVEERRRVLNEWLAWREREEEELMAERRERLWRRLWRRCWMRLRRLCERVEGMRYEREGLAIVSA